MLAVDVVNDLALVKTDYQPEHRFSIQPEKPVQGVALYSLGNPHDLGMILVQALITACRNTVFTRVFILPVL